MCVSRTPTSLPLARMLRFGAPRSSFTSAGSVEVSGSRWIRQPWQVETSSAEDVSTCQGCLIQRDPLTSTDPADVNDDLGAPNRNIRANGKDVGVRLTHMADFVYSLTDFVRNPNPPGAASERGRKIFNDPQTNCTSCHLGGPGAGEQFFTDKKPNASFDPGQPGAADHNNPFVRHDVGTMNLFDAESPLAIAQMDQVFQNPRVDRKSTRLNSSHSQISYAVFCLK